MKTSEEKGKPAEDLEVTDADLFGSIPKPMDFDPFEGIDLNGVCYRKQSSKITAASAWTVNGSTENPDADEYIEINPIEGVDLKDISIQTGSDTAPEERGVAESSGQWRPAARTTAENRPSRSQPPRHPDPSQPPPKVPPATAKRTQTTPAEPPSKMAPTAAKQTHATPAESRSEYRGPNPLKGAFKRAFKYSELNRIKDKILNSLQHVDGHSVILTSPHDDAGSTFLTLVLGYSSAYFSKKNVLLVDLNMRRPQLHLPFDLPMERGFKEVASEALPLSDVIKPTDLTGLSVITAGHRDIQLSSHLTRELLNDFMAEIQTNFDLVFIDTSPVLIQNRNNVDAILLSTCCDLTMLVVQENKTTKNDVKKAVTEITDGGSHVSGVIYNQQFRKNLLPNKMQRMVRQMLNVQ